jgi:hypothetical protein
MCSSVGFLFFSSFFYNNLFEEYQVDIKEIQNVFSLALHMNNT